MNFILSFKYHVLMPEMVRSDQNM